MKIPFRTKGGFDLLIIPFGVCAPIICHVGGKVGACGYNEI